MLEDTQIHPRRHLRITGPYNVRDLGGYSTTAGQVTRWRRFLRADLLARLPSESQDVLVEYGIRTAIDLRQTREVAEIPSVLAESSQIAYIHQNLLGDDDPPAGEPDFTPRGIANSYAWILNKRQSQIRETLSTLATPEASPAVFYCAGGTDRTGIIAALLLGIAGVPNNIIAEDYRLSAKGLVEGFLAEGPPAWMPIEDLLSGQALLTLAATATMKYTLDYLDQDYGGAEGYAHAIGLSNEQLSALRGALLT